MQQPTVKVNFIFILILGILSMLPPLSIDMYLPAFLNIAQDLNVQAEQVQHTLTFFTFGMAIGQLIWGPIGDSFGRKPIILLGIIIGAVASFLLTSVAEINNFILLRFIQGFFGSASVVLVGALLRDLFDKNDFSKMMSTIMLVVMVAPLIAPIIGGYLVVYFHWHLVFYVLMGVGILSALLVFFYIPETHKKENRLPLRLGDVLHNFFRLWREKAVVGYMLVSGFSFAGMYTFLTSGSIVYIGIYGISTENFGYFFMINISVMILASFINGRIVNKVGAENMLRFGLFIQFIMAIWLMLVIILKLGFWPMAIGIAIFVGHGAMIGSNAMASILDKFPNMAGTANSMAGTVRFGIGAIVGSLVALMEMKTATPMVATISLCGIVSMACYYFLTYRNLPHSTKE